VNRHCSDDPQADPLLTAASALVADRGLPTNNQVVDGLLRFLDYHDADVALRQSRARLLRAAARFRRLFHLPVPDAPGLIFLGGKADPACLGAAYAALRVGSLSGSGVTPQRAFEACVGEGIEYLSQFARDGDDIETNTLHQKCTPPHDHRSRFVAAALAASNVDPEQSIDWLSLQRLPAGDDAWFPADLCLRRSAAQRDFAPPLKLSTGCAAGATHDDAALRALLELVERDAAALWWRGGRRGRAIAPDSEAGHAAAELIEQLRQGNRGRTTRLLDITSDLGIPVIAVISARADGRGFAFGLAARLAPAEAARAAIFEMCQGELAHHVVAAKRREAGDARLNESDRRRLQHGELIDTRVCTLFQPQGESWLAPSSAAVNAATGLQDVLARLAAQGIAAYMLDLTRPDFQVPVIHVLAPGLQVEPCTIVSERLARAMRETGGGAVHTAGLPLL
jgi:ribosomal protein S12 methylthiotransferase accessory factor